MLVCQPQINENAFPRSAYIRPRMPILILKMNKPTSSPSKLLQQHTSEPHQPPTIISPAQTCLTHQPNQQIMERYRQEYQEYVRTKEEKLSHESLSEQDSDVHQNASYMQHSQQQQESYIKLRRSGWYTDAIFHKKVGKPLFELNNSSLSDKTNILANQDNHSQEQMLQNQKKKFEHHSKQSLGETANSLRKEHVIKGQKNKPNRWGPMENTNQTKTAS